MKGLTVFGFGGDHDRLILYVLNFRIVSGSAVYIVRLGESGRGRISVSNRPQLLIADECSLAGSTFSADRVRC
jgi:hypothetical protein